MQLLKIPKRSHLLRVSGLRCLNRGLSRITRISRILRGVTIKALPKQHRTHTLLAS